MAKTPTKTSSKKSGALATKTQNKTQNKTKLKSRTAVRSGLKTKTSISAKKATDFSKKSKAKPDSKTMFMGLSLKPWTAGAELEDADHGSGDVPNESTGFIYAFGQRHSESAQRLINDITTEHLHGWQADALGASELDVQLYQGNLGPVWIVRGPSDAVLEAAALAPLAGTGQDKSGYARFRDLFGALLGQALPLGLGVLKIEFHEMSLEEERGAMVGFEVAAYRYTENASASPKARRPLPKLSIIKKSEAFDRSELAAAANLGLSVNLARHLVNIPANVLDPRAYAENVERLFRGSRTVKVEVWEGARLKAERMNLMIAVGAAATEGPRLVHLRYRPQKSTRKMRPVALVGKGVTFDSGGLDIKPSSGMRWMKKDMGGSAACLAIAKWAEQTELQMPLDIYLALAENAISGNAFRPGDIVTSRNGLTIEIHNTDAEGRLVLADALDVAVTQTGANEPVAVINVATLTGAIKVGLGAEIAGLFSNNDELSSVISEAGQATGDLSWRMPLFQPYKALFKSNFADFANASEGFGGAITAALFLELFVKNKPWAHLDVYAWKDSASGAWGEAGGSGQPVQALSEVLLKFASGSLAGLEALSVVQ